jgi:hypothetical protein
MGKAFQFSRNMTVVVHEGVLTLINTVRLSEEGLAALERLGRVGAIVRLGAFHGLDDAFYAHRYGAPLWALPGQEDAHGAKVARALTAGGEMPVPNCSLFAFETTSAPEGILVLDRDGGILISCDSLQNWCEADAYFDDASRESMAALGFLREANIGPGWRQGTGVRGEDFQRLLAIPFRHVLPAHGTPLLERAKETYAQTIAEAFG